MQMRALVTGASGFVGYWVARKLKEANFNVRAMVRSTPPQHLQNLDIEIVKGDLTNVASLEQAISDCDYVFHVAAHYRLWEKDPQTFYTFNVEGSRNLFEVSAQKNIQRIIYTSSVATLPTSSDGTPVNEDANAELKDIIGHYKRSKYLAEKVATELAKDSVPIVIVNPSTPVGAYDIKPTPTGKIIVDFLKGKIPAYVDTGLNLVSVEDVAIGHLLALEYGELGERYILGHQNMSFLQILQTLAQISHRSAPKIKMPYWIAYAAAYCSESWARLVGAPPGIPLDGVRMSKKKMFFDNTKAREKLGFAPQDITVALEQAVQWFEQNKYV